VTVVAGSAEKRKKSLTVLGKFVHSNGRRRIFEILLGFLASTKLGATDSRDPRKPRKPRNRLTMPERKIVRTAEQLERYRARNARKQKKRRAKGSEEWKQREKERLLLKTRRRRAAMTEEQRKTEAEQRKVRKQRQLASMTEEEKQTFRGNAHRLYLHRRNPPDVFVVSDGLPQADEAVLSTMQEVYLVTEDVLLGTRHPICPCFTVKYVLRLSLRSPGS